jgi:hypothetical protein
MNPAAVDGELREAFDVGRVKALEPSLQRRRAAAAGDRKRDLGDDRRDPMRVAGGVCVLQRRLELAPRLVPVRRAAVESRNEVRFLFSQLPQEEITEKVVEAEPPAPAVEPHEEEVRVGDSLELALGPFALQHRVAEWS